jgi:trypsin-like peptidase
MKTHRISRLTWLAALAAAACQIASIAYGATRTDTVVRPGEGAAQTRPTPRAIGAGKALDTLFPAGERIETPALEVPSLVAEDEAGAFEAQRMGVIENVRVSSYDAGEWTTLADGGWLWTASFRASGASALELRIAPWKPPSGAEVIVFSAADPSYAAGPFTLSYPNRLDAFWTPSLYTDEVRLEYYLPPGSDPAAEQSELIVTGVLNQYRPLRLGPEKQQVLGCHLDVNCYPVLWGVDADGVGVLSYVSNQYGFFCSGGLLNRIPEDFTPLFLTAHHCVLNNPGDPTTNGWVTWFWESTGCNSGVSVNLFTLPQTLATSTIAEDPTERSPGVFGGTDIRLLGLREQIPGGAAFLGWDSGAWANNSEAIGIHHPAGSFKRISFGTKIDNAFCSGRTTYEVNYDQGGGYGSFEPGSSGSPVFDADHRVRGVGSCADTISTCIGIKYVGYGQFADAYPRALEAFLAPVDPVYVNGSYGGFERGTNGEPFNRLVEGSFAVIRSRNVFVTAGSYNERFTLDRAMTINAVGGTVVVGQ